jgi:hypothetical protein
MGIKNRREWRKGLRILPAMPLHIWLYPKDLKVILRREAEEYRFESSSAPRKKRTIAEEITGPDVWQMRDDFLRVSTPAEAFDFLGSRPPFLPSGGKKTLSLSWTDFRRWQRLLKLIALNGFPLKNPDEASERKWFLFRDFSESPDETAQAEVDAELQELQDLLTPTGASDELLGWLQGNAQGVTISAKPPIHMKLHPDDAPVSCVVTVSTVVEALLATVYFDKTVQIRIKKCERMGCENIFESKTKHDGRFCSIKCAHTQQTADRRKLMRIERTQNG